MCTYMLACIHRDLPKLHTRIRTCIKTYLCTWICAQTQVYVHICLHVYKHLCMCVYIYVCIHTCTQFELTSVHTCSHVFIHAYIYLSVYVCLYTYIYIRTCMYAYSIHNLDYTTTCLLEGTRFAFVSPGEWVEEAVDLASTSVEHKAHSGPGFWCVIPLVQWFLKASFYTAWCREPCRFKDQAFVWGFRSSNFGLPA